jgi:hypothetical protein
MNFSQIKQWCYDKFADVKFEYLIESKKKCCGKWKKGKRCKNCPARKNRLILPD